MRALGDRRRKTPVEPAKTEPVTPKTEGTTPAPVEQSDSFDESVVIN